MAIARSMAMWPLIAVAMVRRTNLRTLKTHLRFGFGSGGGKGLVSVSRVDSWSLFVDAMIALDFFRLIGQEGSSSVDDGGGGSGEELISPMRRSVRVSWAFVGTPSRSILSSLEFVRLDMARDLLLDVEWLGPVREEPE